MGLPDPLAVELALEDGRSWVNKVRLALSKNESPRPLLIKRRNGAGNREAVVQTRLPAKECLIRVAIG